MYPQILRSAPQKILVPSSTLECSLIETGFGTFRGRGKLSFVIPSNRAAVSRTERFQLSTCEVLSFFAPRTLASMRP